MKIIISLFLILIRDYKFGEHFKIHFKRMNYDFQIKSWSVGLFLAKNKLEKSSWKKVSFLSKFTYSSDQISGFADPFLINHENITYLFTESIVNGKGEIWVSTIKENKIQKPQPIIVSSFHMSYPNVFKHEDTFYMIPETNENKTVLLYKADQFPYIWSVARVLHYGNHFVDTTFIMVGEIYYWFTYDLDSKLTRLFFSESLEGIWTEHPKSNFVCNRNAGDFIKLNDKIIRPVQVSKNKYGEGVSLMLLKKISKELFEEEVYDLDFLTTNSGFTLHGVHHISYLESQNLIAIDGKNNNFHSLK